MSGVIEALAIIGGIILFAFVLMLWLDGGTGFSGDGPKAPPPRKPPPGVSG